MRDIDEVQFHVHVWCNHRIGVISMMICPWVEIQVDISLFSVFHIISQSESALYRLWWFISSSKSVHKLPMKIQFLQCLSPQNHCVVLNTIKRSHFLKQYEYLFPFCSTEMYVLAFCWGYISCNLMAHLTALNIYMDLNILQGKTIMAPIVALSVVSQRHKALLWPIILAVEKWH